MKNLVEIGMRLKQARISAGFKTAKAAADSLGIPYPTYIQHENGTRGIGREADLYSRRYRVTLDWLLRGKGMRPVTTSTNISNKLTNRITDGPTNKELPNQKIVNMNSVFSEPIPVYGQAVAGEDGEFIMNGNVLYDIMAPPVIAAIPGAYAICVSGDSMSPRYDDGEIAFVDPTHRVRKGDYVVVQIQMEENGPLLGFIKRFIRHSTTELVLEQLNPLKTMTFSHNTVVSVHYIAGTKSN